MVHVCFSLDKTQSIVLVLLDITFNTMQHLKKTLMNIRTKFGFNPFTTTQVSTLCRFIWLNLSWVTSAEIYLVQGKKLTQTQYKLLGQNSVNPFSTEASPAQALPSLATFLCSAQKLWMPHALKAGYLLKYITCSNHTLHTYWDMNNWYHIRIWIHLKHYFSFSTYWKTMTKSWVFGFLGKTERTQVCHSCQC